MGVAKSVFASRAERENFNKLRSRWGDRYDLWHNIPFLNIFTRKNLINPDVNDLRSITVSDIDWQRLKKTSVDYVLCDQADDTPLVCIDFDGFQNGVNVGRQYLAGVENPDPWRDLIMSLKLIVAHGSLFPYFVVGTREFADISTSVRRCIVDGIIGEILAKRAVTERFASGLSAADAGMSDEDWNTVPPWDQREIMLDLAMDIEIDADFAHNPLYAELAKLAYELGHPSGSRRYVDTPGTRRDTSGRRLEEPRIIGAEHTVRTADVGTVTRTAWLPNFRTPGFSGYGLVEEIAHLLALDEVRRRRARTSQTSVGDR